MSTQHLASSPWSTCPEPEGSGSEATDVASEQHQIHDGFSLERTYRESKANIIVGFPEKSFTLVISIGPFTSGHRCRHPSTPTDHQNLTGSGETEYLVCWTEYLSCRPEYLRCRSEYLSCRPEYVSCRPEYFFRVPQERVEREYCSVY